MLMQKNVLSAGLLIFIFFISAPCIAQHGIITAIVGTGGFGYSGDGGPATAATMDGQNSIAFDAAGNLYITDGGMANRIRVVNTAGIINTFAGNGTMGFSGDGGPATAAETGVPYGIAADIFGNVYFADNMYNVLRKVNASGIISSITGMGLGFSGDGGPATAASLNAPYGVAVDPAGNVYFSDYNNRRVRKINTSGIISTVAGNGTYAATGDGSPATVAGLMTPQGIAVDGFGNIYIADKYSERVRKVNTAGFISTIAGTGTGGYSGDGGAATAAQLHNPCAVAIDNAGDVFIADDSSSRIRMIDPTGIITTIAGYGGFGTGGDGGPATATQFNNIYSLAIDAMGNVLVSDYWNARIRKVTGAPSLATANLSVSLNNVCTGIQFQVVTNTYVPGQYIRTYFGDGSVATNATGAYGATRGIVTFSNSYTTNGTYTIKHVLFNGTTAIDSITYSRAFIPCQNLTVGFYYDSHHDCVKAPDDIAIRLPSLLEVDSNGVPVDTISATSGFSYTAYCCTGDIYSFRMLTPPNGFVVSCPASGVIYDTLFTHVNPVKNFGFECASSPARDLAIFVNSMSGRHMQTTDIELTNTNCSPQASTISLNYSNKYGFVSAVPAPTTISGSTLTWDMNISALDSGDHIHASFAVPGAWLIPHTYVSNSADITPMVDDIDTLNNTWTSTDTVRGSWDPNEMTVVPGYCIPAVTETMLEYTIEFQNTGNDTAHNIYIMDTLSDNVSPHSLKIINSTAAMNISQFTAGGHNIVKFDMPGINLLDSSYHDQSTGFVSFYINTKTGLANGAIINNEAGIYFDDNAVVMTNSVQNVVGCATKAPAVITGTGAALYPNPATDELFIKTTSASWQSFTITDNVGQLLLQQPINGLQTKADVHSLPPGVYYVTLKGDNGVNIQKFVKL